MEPIAVSSAVFASLLLGGFVGLGLRRLLPEHHLSAESKDVVKVGTGLIGTMAALLLGLLVASAKSSFDTEKDEVAQLAAKVSYLDRLLARYGSESQEARHILRDATSRAIEHMWPTTGTAPAQLDPNASSGEALFEALQRLSPQTEQQTALKAMASQTASELGQIRWLLFAQKESSIATPMLVVVVFWLTAIFVSLGLFAPGNTTVIATMCLCALSIAGAIFLILELDQPFGGFIPISSAPMQATLENLGK